MVFRRSTALVAVGLAAVLLFHIGQRCMGAQSAALNTLITLFQPGSTVALHADVTRGHPTIATSMISLWINIPDAMSHCAAECTTQLVTLAPAQEACS
jgi:hypothetical protein